MGIATLLAAQVLRALPRVRISRAVGRLCEKPLPPVVSRAVTSIYSRAELATTQGGDPSYEAGIAVGGPLVEGKLGARLSVWYRRDGGWIDHIDPYTLTVDDKKVAESRIDKTNPLGKFTLDESFDVGMDTGSPVIDDYEAKMPFKFTGTLRKVEIKLGPDKLTSNEKIELQRLRRERALATQ